MKQPKDIILNVLKAQSDGYAMTAREIYNEMEPSEQGKFKLGPDGVSKTIGYMRTCGLVENGVSEIFKGRTVLTWKLKTNDEKKNMANKEPAKSEAVSETEIQIDVQADFDSPAREQLVQAGTIQTETSTDLSESAIETLGRDGYIVLDPFSESDQFVCEVVNRLKVKTTKIGDKELKISTLENLAPLLSTDIHDVLMNIVDDLKRLEAA